MTRGEVLVGTGAGDTVIKAAGGGTNYIGQRGGLCPYARPAGSPFETKLCRSGKRRLYRLFENVNSRDLRWGEDRVGVERISRVAAGRVTNDFRSMRAYTTSNMLTFNHPFCLREVSPAGGFRS